MGAGGGAEGAGDGRDGAVTGSEVVWTGAAPVEAGAGLPRDNCVGAPVGWSTVSTTGAEAVPQTGQKRLLGVRTAWQLGQVRDMQGVLGIGHTKLAEFSSPLSRNDLEFRLAVGTANAVMLAMMTPLSLRPLRQMTAFWAAAFVVSFVAAQPAPGSVEDQQSRVQITEVGLLRTLVMVDESSTDMHQKLVNELIKRDFSVHESPQYAGTGITTQEMAAAGEAANADLVIYANVTDQQIDNYAGGVRYSAEASIKVINRVTGRTLAWNDPEEIRGARSNMADRARKDARTKAINHGIKGAVEQILASAHKMVVHRAVLVNVFTESDLLAKMESIARLPEIYHVRRVEFDRKTHEALVEIIGAPRSETFWRAHIEQNMPKTKLAGLNPNLDMRNKIPSWIYQPSGR